MLAELGSIIKLNAERHGRWLGTQERIAAGTVILRRALNDQLLEPGDVLGSQGFVPWGLTAEAALERIEDGWRQAGDNLTLGDVCWLANPPAGDDHAKRVQADVLRRVGWPPSPPSRA